MGNGTSFAEAIELDKDIEVQSFVSYTEPYRFFKINCVVGNTYSFRAFSDSDTTATLYTDIPTQVDFDDDSGGNRNPMLQFTAVTSVMYVEIANYSRPTTGETFNFTVLFAEFDATRVQGVSLHPSSTQIVRHQTFQFDVIIEPETAVNRNVIWELSDYSGNIVTMDETGLITGVNPGRVDIRVTTEDGGYEAYAFITVRNTGDTLYCVRLGNLIGGMSNTIEK